MERFKKRLLAALSIMAGMTMVMAIGFWTLRANAYVRPNVIVTGLHPMTVGGLAVTTSNAASVVTSPMTNLLPPAVVFTPITVTKLTLAPVPVIAPPAEEHAGILNLNRQFALGMIETANDDHEIGHLGEISRFQIMPSVWRRYSRSREYQNPDVSAQVARQHWLSLYNSFKRQARREPTDFDMYVLWNTSYSYYASHNWQPAHLGAVVRDRAQRFANLVERGNI